MGGNVVVEWSRGRERLAKARLARFDVVPAGAIQHEKACEVALEALAGAAHHISFLSRS